MRIFKNELIRLWKTPGILLALAMACLMTVMVLNMKVKELLNYVQPEDYKEAFSRLEGISPEDAYALYSGKEYDVLDFSYEAFLYRTVKSELEAQTAYEEYLEGVSETAHRLTTLSVFADEAGFSYRNAQKISEVYERLKGRIVVRSGPSKGVELWSGNGIMGLIVILVILAMINEMVLKDRESGQLSLLFTMYKGRGVHGFVKLCVLITSSFIVSFLILLIAFITTSSLLGIGDITRPVQSIVGLKGCTIETSVLGYMLIYYLMLAVDVSVMSIMIFLIASLLKSPVMVYMALAALFGTESVLYYIIGDNNYMAFLKEFNLISFLNCDRYLSIYDNVSIFGYPVSRFVFVLISLCVLALCLFPMAVKAYSMQTTTAVKKPRARVGVIRRFHTKSVSIFIHETHKLLICGGTIWLILLFVVFRILSYTPVRERFEDENEVYYKRYALSFAGPVTEENLMRIDEERKRYIEIERELKQELNNCPTDLAEYISMQYQDKLKPRTGLEMLATRARQLKEYGGYILYDKGYRLLLFGDNARRNEVVMAITVGVMLVLSVTYLFAGDDSIYADSFTSVTLKGRRELCVMKLIIGSIIALVLYLVNYLPYYISVFNVYGNNGFDFPVQSVSGLENTIFAHYGVTVGTAVVFFMITRYLLMIAGMLFLSFISKRLRNISRTLVTGLIILVGPLLVVYVLL